MVPLRAGKATISTERKKSEWRKRRGRMKYSVDPSGERKSRREERKKKKNESNITAAYRKKNFFPRTFRAARGVRKRKRVGSSTSSEKKRDAVV